MFRMLKLKPPNGWQGVAWELGIVTLGVLIALGAQQMVEDWSWRNNVRHAERQLVAEGKANFFYAAERVVVKPCIDAQVDRMVALALAPGARLKPLPPIPSNRGPMALRQPSRPFQTDAWDGIVGDGVAAHFENDRRDLFSVQHTQINELRGLSASGDYEEGRLRQFLVPLELDPTVRSRLIEQVLSQKGINDLAGLDSIQAMSRLWALGKAPPAKDVDNFVAQNSGTVKYCRDRGLPLNNWRVELAAERAVSGAANDEIGRYLASHR